MASIKPLQDRIIVRRFESEEKTASGIIIPDSAKEKPFEGEIIAVGQGGKVFDNGTRVEPTVKVGDKVLFAKYAGTEVKFDGGEDFLIMREDDILGIIEG